MNMNENTIYMIGVFNSMYNIYRRSKYVYKEKRYIYFIITYNFEYVVKII